MKVILAVALVLVGPLGVTTAHADSDGYYCAGRGYLAYQFGFAAPSLAGHRLHIVRFGGPAGIERPIVFDLPQFQVHGILCGERSVRLAGYDAIYTVELDERSQPVRHHSVPWADKVHLPAEFVGHSPNLGAWNRTANSLTRERVPLGPVAGGGRSFLDISGRAVESERCASIVTSRIVRTDRNGREVQQLEIFRDRGVRDCGGH